MSFDNRKSLPVLDNDAEQLERLEKEGWSIYLSGVLSPAGRKALPGERIVLDGHQKAELAKSEILHIQTLTQLQVWAKPKYPRGGGLPETGGSMIDLDTKLREILNDVVTEVIEGNGYNPDSVIAQIHQAFTEAGYTEPWSDADLERLISSYTALAAFKAATMTGQEWFDKFEQKLIDGNRFRARGHDFEAALEAARRAAGLES